MSFCPLLENKYESSHKIASSGANAVMSTSCPIFVTPLTVFPNIDGLYATKILQSVAKPIYFL